MQIITPAIKDKVLYYLCESCQLEQLVYNKTGEILKDTDTDYQTLYAVLSQFERLKFLRQLGVGQENTCFILQIEAHDLIQKGGFVAQEEIFEANINKLNLEIDNLKKELAPNHLETINKISSIASALFGGLSLFKK